MKIALASFAFLIAFPCFAQSGAVIGKIADSNRPVHAGERISTRSGERTRILFDDQTAIQLGSDTEVTLVRVGKGATVVHLIKGGVLSRIKPLKQERITPRFMIRTKSAVMGVRGTTFYVQQDAGKPTFLCVCEGKVDVTWRGHKTTRSSHHHDAPVWLDQTRPSMVPAPMGTGHSDEEGAALGKLLGID